MAGKCFYFPRNVNLSGTFVCSLKDYSYEWQCVHVTRPVGGTMSYFPYFAN